MKPERLRALVGDIFMRAGMVEANARTVADVLVWADLRGMGSHGVMRVPRYVDWMKRGDLNGRPQITTTESGATITKRRRENRATLGIGHSLSFTGSHCGLLDWRSELR